MRVCIEHLRVCNACCDQPYRGIETCSLEVRFFYFFSVKEEKRGRALVSEGTEEKMKGETEGVAVQSTAAMFNGLNRIVWSVSPSF